MISVPDRRQAVELIDEARKGGARLEPACRLTGLTVRTYQRWTASGTVRSDRRPDSPRPVPRNKLSDQERAQVLSLCHEWSDTIMADQLLRYYKYLLKNSSKILKSSVWQVFLTPR